ncbi:MAG: DoxX family membrane protein [SAR202 cluster bacterium]|nr:hypothetical protein [Chloroflexota bacterium]MQG51719.1 DoxX family membrane protein [SAR202 cluster bacterium]
MNYVTSSNFLWLIKNTITLVYGGWFIYIGIQHFVDPEWFEPIVPVFLGYPKFWVLFSGLIEILLGAFLIIPFTRKISGVCLVIFLIVIYIANINMWIFDIPIDGNKLTTQGHIIRGFAQILLITIALYIVEFNPINYLRLKLRIRQILR